MKKIVILLLAAILNLNCNAQEDKKGETLEKEGEKLMAENPKGTWKVDKEFDEDGNLIHYDSIYSWSSEDELGDLSALNRDSTLRSMKSKFYRHFSQFGDQGFGDFFTEDSLFSKQFFDDDFFTSEFGKDFMDIDRIRERMEARQQEFLEKYRSEFEDPDNKGSKESN